MKKILGIIGLFGLVLMSCKNDAIDIEKTATPEPPKSLSISVSTTSAYEKYGLTDYQNYLGSNSNVYIGVTSLLYDSNGVLVDSVSSYSRTFNTLTQTIDDVYNGQYTLITFETFVDRTKGFMSNNWRLADVNKLETVQIHNEEYNVVDWQYSIGVSTSTVTVNSNTQTSVQANSTPKAIGVLLDLGYENFNKSGYIWLGFELKNVASGYYLNPALSSTERYKYDDGYNAEHTWSSRGYFYNTSGLADSDSKKFYMLESGNIQYCFGATDSKNESGGLSFRALPSGNSYFNFVDGEYYKAYTIYTGYDDELETYVGSQSDFGDWRTKVINEIVNRSLFRIPYLVWGGSVSAVQSYMSGYTAGNNAPEAKGDYYILWYYGKDRESEIDYYFKTNTGDLQYANVFFDSNIGEDEIQSQIVKDGFSLAYYDEDENVYYYLSSDENTVAAFFKNSDGDWIVRYYAFNAGGGSSESTLFEAPCLDWGASKSSVKNYMSSNGFELMNEGDSYLYYNPKYKEKYTYMGFDSNSLSFDIVYFDQTATSISELENVLKNSGAIYYFTSDETGSIFYNSADGKSVIYIGSDDDYGVLHVGYMPVVTSSSRAKSNLENRAGTYKAEAYAKSGKALRMKSAFKLKGEKLFVPKVKGKRNNNDIKYEIKLKE